MFEGSCEELEWLLNREKQVRVISEEQRKRVTERLARVGME
ncbi:hypothetical protein [Bacillus toyonensis]|nr:hypothetical protein [Bacillus toyonensis]